MLLYVAMYLASVALCWLVMRFEFQRDADWENAKESEQKKTLWLCSIVVLVPGVNLFYVLATSVFASYKHIRRKIERNDFFFTFLKLLFVGKTKKQ